MRKITDGLKYWGQLLLLPVYGLSFFMPRDKKIWLFGSTFGRRFADNPRYMYIEISAGQQGDVANKVKEKLNIEKQNIRPIWISRRQDIVDYLKDNGYEAYNYKSLKGKWYALRAGVYFYDNYSKDINFWLSGGAMKVNLWHGIPLKMIQHDNLHDTFRHPKNKWEKLKNFPRNISDEKPSDYIVSPSRMFDDIFSRAFKTKNVIKAEYPRWNVLKDKDGSKFALPLEQRYLDRIKSFKEQRQKGKVITYMPTFRDSEVKLLDEIREIGLDKIECYLKKQDYMLIIKLHPKSKIKDGLKEMLKGCSKRIVLIKDDCDSNLFMSEADLLITDYSSCYFDYLIVDKPIIYFNYDYKEYINESRDLYFDYEDMTAGNKVEDIRMLCDAIDNALKKDDDMVQKRKMLINKIWNGM